MSFVLIMLMLYILGMLINIPYRSKCSRKGSPAGWDFTVFLNVHPTPHKKPFTYLLHAYLLV